MILKKSTLIIYGPCLAATKAGFTKKFASSLNGSIIKLLLQYLIEGNQPEKKVSKK